MKLFEKINFNFLKMYVQGEQTQNYYRI
jgi:hypothetical protein